MIFGKKINKPSPEITKEMVYNYMIDSFKNSVNQLLNVPCNDCFSWCVLRRLNMIEIKSCGDFSLIETMRDKLFKTNKEKYTLHEMSEYAELQYSIIKMSLVKPAYDDLINEATRGTNYDHDKFNDQIFKIENLFNELSQSSDINDKKEALKLQEEYAALELRYKFLLPVDFVTFIFNYAVGNDISDIKLITEDILHNAAISAKLAGNSPSDHISGRFSDFNKYDINNRSWVLYAEKQKFKGNN